MNKKLLLFLIIGIVFVNGCTTVVRIPPQQVINPVYIEKTISNVEISYFNLNCRDENFDRIDTRNITYGLYLDEYVSRTIEDDWMKTTIHYPITEFHLDIYKFPANYGECDIYGSIKIEITDSNNVPYFTECRIETNNCAIFDCELEINKQIFNCMEEIK